MKKNILIALALTLSLLSCKKEDITPISRSGNNTTQASSAAITPETSTTITPLPPNIPCENYSIYNPHGQLGASIQYWYTDCNGASQSGFLDPQQTIYVKAQPNTIKCPGGVVTLM
jgi:hypothetical protein